MTKQTSPITPPPELVQQWIKDCDNPEKSRWQEYEQDIATQAAQWGRDQRGAANEAELQQRADQELAACCAWLIKSPYGASLAVNGVIEQLRTARRPKPLSLKEQALRILVENGTTLDGRIELEPEDIPIIRRALEQLND